MPTTPDRTASRTAAPAAQQQARPPQLARAHRAAQAAQRAALAVEHSGPLAAAEDRLQALTTAIRQAAYPVLAAALEAEASSGAVLQCLLTADDDTSAGSLPHALVDYQHRRDDVDALLTEPTSLKQA